MQGVEFKGKPHEDVVDLPAELRGWNGHQGQVIFSGAECEPVAATPSFTAFMLMARDFRFSHDEANAH